MDQKTQYLGQSKHSHVIPTGQIKTLSHETQRNTKERPKKIEATRNNEWKYSKP